MRYWASAFDIDFLQRIQHSNSFINLQAQLFIECQDHRSVLHTSAIVFTVLDMEYTAYVAVNILSSTGSR